MKALGESLLGLVCACYAPFRAVRPSGTNPPRVIAIVSNTALGDTLLSTPVVASARASFPDARILFIIHPRYEKLLTGLPGADQIVLYDGGYRQFLPTLNALRRNSVDTVLLAHSNGPQDIALGLLSGAVTLLKPATRSPLRKYLSTQLQPSKGHIIEERCALIRYLNGRTVTTRMVLPTRYHGDLPPAFPRLPAPLVGLQLGAANHYKMWPVEYFAALAEKLLSAWPDLTLVITGAATEKRLARALLKRVPDRRILDHTGRHPVEELPWLLRQMSVLVTNDTGPMHLAIAIGTPTVSLFGLTSSRAIGPYQDLDKHIVLQSPLEGEELHLPKKRRSNRAMIAISVEEAFHAVRRLLETQYAPAARH